MNALNHPNILKFFSIFFGDDKNPPAIVLEFCPENLSHAISNNKLSNINMARAIYQIAEGMKFIHFQEIIHRDLKPSNILIAADGTIKISDFGISKLMSPDETTMTVGVGTNKFMAPEIIAEEDDYNEKVDVYSFGVLMFYILSNGILPMIKTPQILQGKKAEIPSSFTEFSKKLINDCWNFKPSERPSFVDIVERLKTGCSQLLEFNEKEKNCPRFNISLNSKVLIKCSQKDAELFREAFEAVFQSNSNEENKKYVFDSTSFLKFTLTLKYFNPRDPDFNEDREYTLDIRPIELNKQTKTFHDMIKYIFDSVMKSVRTKVKEKKRELQMNGNNYS